MNNGDRQKLIETLGRYPAERYAVVDGAHFDNIAIELSNAQLEGEPLFLSDMGDGAELSGPWLVGLPDWEAANRVLTLVGELPAVVFWSWGDGQKALYKHLRRINMVEIPVDDYNPDFPDWDRVVFRHGDPNVMANALSVLEEEQFAKVLGNAAALIMYAPDFGGLQEAPALENEVEIPKGLLRFEIEQIEAIGDKNLNASRENVALYLREVAPDQTSSMSEAQLKTLVIKAEKEGNSIGFESEHAHGLWAFLAVITGGALLTSPEIRDHFASTSDHPDDAVEKLVDDIANASDEELSGYL